MNRYLKMFLMWWLALAAIYACAVIALTIAFGFISAWSFGMNGDSPSFIRNRWFFPTQLFMPLSDRVGDAQIIAHAISSGLFYAITVSAVITLRAKEKGE